MSAVNAIDTATTNMRLAYNKWWNTTTKDPKQYERTYLQVGKCILDLENAFIADGNPIPIDNAKWKWDEMIDIKLQGSVCEGQLQTYKDQFFEFSNDYYIATHPLEFEFE